MASIYKCVIILSVCFVHVRGYIPSIYYLDEECNLSVTITKDARLKLTFYSSYLDRNWKCSTTFRTSVTGDTLLVQYRSLDTDWSTNCRKNNMKILDSDKTTVLNRKTGDCGGLPLISSFTTSGDSVSFKFQTDNSFQYGHFDILITSFKMAFNNTCPSGRFHCGNNRCINNNLICNGYNDCGDYTDESCHLGAGVVAGIVIGAFVVIVLCITLSVLGRARRRRYRRLCEAKPYNTCESTTTTYSQPGPYPNVQNPYPQPSYQTYGQ